MLLIPISIIALTILPIIHVKIAQALITITTTTFVTPTAFSINFWILGPFPLIAMIMIVFVSASMILDRSAIVTMLLLGLNCGLLVAYAANTINFGFVILGMIGLSIYAWFGMSSKTFRTESM